MAYARLPNAHNPDPLYINSKFPFLGPTTLDVVGKKILVKKGKTSPDEWAFFVQNIRNCSHPFGFDRLTIECAGSHSNSAKSPERSGPPRPPKKDLEDQEEINDAPADPSMGRVITKTHTSSLDQLVSVHFNKVYSEKEAISGHPHLSGTQNGGSTFENGAAGADGTGNQGVDDIDVQVKIASREILRFIEMLINLRTKTAKYGWEIKTLGYRNDEIVKNETITEFPMMPKRLSWYKIFLDSKDKEGRAYSGPT